MLRRLRTYLAARRARRLHKRLRAPGRLCLGELREACRIMQVDFDGALSGAGMTGTDGAPKMPPLSEAQRFLDLTHPGHGLDVEQMRAADAEAVLGAAAFNFFTASRMSAPATTLSASLTKRLKSSLRQAAAARTSARLRSHPLTSA